MVMLIKRGLIKDRDPNMQSCANLIIRPGDTRDILIDLQKNLCRNF